MRSLTGITGIALTIIGALILAYKGFTYNKQENVAQIGDLKLTAETEKTVYLPPVLGGVSLVAGIFLIILSKKR